MNKLNNMVRVLSLLVIIIAGSISAIATDLPNFIVPRGSSQTSQLFSVGDAGELTVNVKIRVAPLDGSNNAGGTSRYKAELLPPAGAAVDTGEIVVGANFGEISLTTMVTCAQTGRWKIKVTNTSTDNKQRGEAEIPSFDPPTVETYEKFLSMFTVNQGTEEIRNITGSIKPHSPGGRLTITAEWDVRDPVDPSAYKATFTLLRNGSPYKPNAGGKSQGYSSSATFDGSTPKVRISVKVPLADVSGNWKLLVKAPSTGTMINVKPKVTFKEGCD